MERQSLFDKLATDLLIRYLCRAIGLTILLATFDIRTVAAKVIFESPQDTAGQPSIENGEKQDVDQWPATLKYYAPNGRDFICTATLVGERVVLTAAHCLLEDGLAEVRVRGLSPVEITCSRHPSYQHAGLQADIALCQTAVPIHPTFSFENLDLRITRVRKNSELFLLGFGCRDVNRPGDPQLVGQLYGGRSTVFALSVEPGGHFQTRGGVVICPGDSGGSAYLLGDRSSPSGPRSIVGINSGYVADTKVSYITSMTAIVADFVRDWAEDNSVAICGVHNDARNCRDRFVP